MAYWTLAFLLLLATGAMAGEIAGDRGFIPVDETAPAEEQTETAGTEHAEIGTGPGVAAAPKATGNTTGDERSGLEPNQPIYGGGYDSGVNAYNCPTIRYRNKCYYMALSQENWYTGRDYCARTGQTLARIDSADEATFLASYLYEGGLHNYWVDLNDERTEGVWIRTDGQPGYIDFWAPNEPNGNRGENCGLLVIGNDRIGRLVDDPCGEWRRYICERRTDTVCRRAGYKQKCYWFSVQPATWFNAREYCATMGQRLARVTSLDESNYLARVQPRPSWIDLRYGGQGVGWTYADGTSSSMVAGLFGSAGLMGGYGYGQRCAELRRYNQNQGRSVGEDCNALRQFICESQPLPAGSELDNPEDIEGSVFGSQLGGPAMGPAGPVNPMDPQMTGGIAGLGPNMVQNPMGGMGMGMGMGWAGRRRR